MIILTLVRLSPFFRQDILLSMTNSRNTNSQISHKFIKKTQYTTVYSLKYNIVYVRV